MLKELSILFFTFLLSLNIGAQSLDTKIIEGFRLGNTSMIQPFLLKEIELILPDEEGIMSMDKAIQLIKKFYSDKKVSDFRMIHEGASPAGSTYHIGMLTTDVDSFRIYILSTNGSENVINEIRIETDE